MTPCLHLHYKTTTFFSSFIIYVILPVYFQINKSSSRQPVFSESGGTVLSKTVKTHTFSLTSRVAGMERKNTVHFYIFKLNSKVAQYLIFTRSPRGKLGAGKELLKFSSFLGPEKSSAKAKLDCLL